MITRKVHMVQKFLFFFTFLSLFLTQTTNANSFRNYSKKDGLSNPVVASIFQDHNGLMWFGTNDGLNAYDGLHFHNFQNTEESFYLTGHTIGDIIEGENNTFWVLTNYGLSHMDRGQQAVKNFEAFDLSSKMVQAPDNHIYLIKEDHSICYYDDEEETFRTIPVNDLVLENIINLFVDEDYTLWVFMSDGNHRNFSIQRTQNEVKLSSQSVFNHQEPILWCFYGDHSIYFVDETLTLYEYNISNKTKFYIQDIRASVSQKGAISSIIKHEDDFYIGFAEGGLIRIKNMPEHKNQRHMEEIPFTPGVLSLRKDRYQDIVWIGTNGQGVYMFFNEASSLGAVLSKNLSHSIHSPITALYKDSQQTLWIGSAGNGIVNIHEYNPDRGTGTRSEFFLPFNSLLGSSTINTFGASAKRILWVGTDNGINYYSYMERRIKNVSVVADGKPLKQVRAICEVNDTTLWIATAGEGLVKIHLAGSADTPIIASAKRIYVGDGSESANMFTMAYRENSNTVWFGTQGSGAYKVESDSERVENVLFAKGENQPQNDIFSILKNSEGYWFATGDGLARMVGSEKTIFDENNGFLHKTVHSLLEDNTGNLWMSTNRGVVKFNMEKQTSHLCKQAEEKTIVEFGDGVCYKDPISSMLLFGGENGFVTINENDFVQQDYTPAIVFNGLSVFGKREHIYNHLQTKRDKQTVRLNYDQNVFGISFVANDYIDGREYSYFYKLNEQGDNWVDNGNSNTAFFTYLAPGSYTLSTKYRNNVTGKESKVAQLKISIHPQWYKTWWAYSLYVLVLAGLLYLARYLYIWYAKRRKAAFLATVKQQQHEEEGRVKLDFFSGMSNELYGPLALIQNSSGKILNNPAVSEEIRKQITLIQSNAEQLKNFVYDVNELRVFAANEGVQRLAYLPVSELADALAAMFIKQAGERKINYQIKIKSGLYWISDNYCLCRLIGNLLSIAFINVQDKGSVSVELKVEEGALQIRVSYSGALLAADIPNGSKFNYTQAIDVMEEKGNADTSTFDQRILTINHGIVKGLQGNLAMESADGNTVCTVSLPEYPLSEGEEVEEGNEELPVIILPKKNSLIEPVQASGDTQKTSLLLVDDNADVSCLLTDLLNDTYRVDLIVRADKTLDALHTAKYDLLLIKAVLPGITGIELIQQVKADAAIAHIPCIVLASANRKAERDEAMEAGADLYISKPIDPESMIKEISTLMLHKKVQANFMKSHNLFDSGNGSFATPEDKKFYDKIIEFIGENITDTELSVETISEHMGCATQELYGKIQSITRKTPNEMIREYRVNTAERLLVSTNITVEELINRIGFPSRSGFYKLFMQIHGMTPKNYREQKRKELFNN